MSRFIYLLSAGILFACASTATAASELYRIDTVHSQVLFSVSHNGFSNPVGRIPVARGWFLVDEGDFSSGKAELDIDLAGVDMGDADWNEAVRGSRLLDAGDSRYAHYVSTSVEVINSKQGRMHGTLNLRGKTVPVDVAFTLNREGTTIFGMEKRIGFSARTQLDRRRFDITAFSGSIGQQVKVRLEIEGVADPQAIDKYVAAGRHQDE